MADELNFQIPAGGFDSYLNGIIPDDQAVLAGAFSVAMQQIRDISKADIARFAQVAYSMENMAGLPFANGTDIPTDLQKASYAKTQTALGSGIYGTWTMSNFFGCMSGLPYPLKNIYDGIKQLETANLRSIYQNLYLAVQWKQATVSVQYTSYDDGFGTTYYHVTGVTITNQGGGYLREGASTPTITINGGSGATATLSLGTDVNNVGSNGGGQYGRVLGATLVSSGTDTTTIPTATISAPPGGGWPAMNSVVQGYIDQANTEIQSIKTASASNFEAANVLNVNWDITGTALKQEQRARIDFFPPVPIPYDRWLSTNPTALYVFVDSIPELGMNTEPHMQAQTLEHISNMKNLGGQSIIALMRESRNKERLATVGIGLDNNLPNKLDDQLGKLLLTAGTLPGAVEGVPSKSGVDYTIPANPSTQLVTGGSPCDLNVTTEEQTPKPVAFFDPNIQKLREILDTGRGNISAIINSDCLGPFGNGSGPVFLVDGKLPPGLPPPLSQCGEPPPPDIVVTPCINENGEITIIIVNPEVPIGDAPILDNTGGLPSPFNLNGQTQTLPPNLDSAYTSTTLVPNTYDINDAIDKVVECNCDCWVN
jgi:hypothetical protein